MNRTAPHTKVKRSISQIPFITMFPTDDPLKGVRKLFPNSPDEELEGIKEFLEGYASVVWRIYERLERENPKIIDELIEEKRKREKQKNQGI